MLLKGSREPGPEDGLVVVTVALSLTVILGFAALVVDLGLMFTQRRSLQGVVDAAALAAAQDLPNAETARSTAITFGGRNFAGVTLGAPAPCGTSTVCASSSNASLEVVTPFQAVDAATSPNYVQVRACRTTPATFARVLGVTRLRSCATAVATSTGSGSSTAGPCALCVLGPSGTTLSSTGSGFLVVDNGNIVVNSSNAAATKITNSTGRITALPTSTAVFGIVGGYSASSPTQLQPTPIVGYPPVPDPLASLGVPKVTTNYGGVSISGSASVTLNPGIYTFIKSSSGGTITFNPGTYVITQELTLTKSPATISPSVYAREVAMYFACSGYPVPCVPGQSGAALKLSGGATIDATAPTSGTYQGVSVFYDRENTANLTLTGASTTSLSGTIYAKSGTVSLTGPSGVDTSFSSAVIAGSVIKTGSSALTLNFDASLNAAVLSPSAPADIGLVR